MATYFSECLHDSLDEVHQSSTVEEFYQHFEAIRYLVSYTQPWLPESYFASRFIYGLREDIQRYVISFQPVTVIDVVHLANIYEYSISQEYDHDDVVVVNSENWLHNEEDKVGNIISEDLTEGDILLLNDLQQLEIASEFTPKNAELKETAGLPIWDVELGESTNEKVVDWPWWDVAVEKCAFMQAQLEVQGIQVGEQIIEAAKNNALIAQGKVAEDDESRDDILAVQPSKGYASTKFLRTLFVDVSDAKVMLPTFQHQHYIFRWEPGPFSVASERTYRVAEPSIEVTTRSMNKIIVCVVLADLQSLANEGLLQLFDPGIVSMLWSGIEEILYMKWVCSTNYQNELTLCWFTLRKYIAGEFCTSLRKSSALYHGTAIVCGNIHQVVIITANVLQIQFGFWEDSQLNSLPLMIQFIQQQDCAGPALVNSHASLSLVFRYKFLDVKNATSSSTWIVLPSCTRPTTSLLSVNHGFTYIFLELQTEFRLFQCVSHLQVHIMHIHVENWVNQPHLKRWNTIGYMSRSEKSYKGCKAAAILRAGFHVSITEVRSFPCTISIPESLQPPHKMRTEAMCTSILRVRVPPWLCQELAKALADGATSGTGCALQVLNAHLIQGLIQNAARDAKLVLGNSYTVSDCIFCFDHGFISIVATIPIGISRTSANTFVMIESVQSLTLIPDLLLIVEEKSERVFVGVATDVELLNESFCGEEDGIRKPTPTYVINNLKGPSSEQFSVESTTVFVLDVCTHVKAALVLVLRSSYLVIQKSLAASQGSDFLNFYTTQEQPETLLLRLHGYHISTLEAVLQFIHLSYSGVVRHNHRIRSLHFIVGSRAFVVLLNVPMGTYYRFLPKCIREAGCLELIVSEDQSGWMEYDDYKVKTAPSTLMYLTQQQQQQIQGAVQILPNEKVWRLLLHFGVNSLFWSLLKQTVEVAVINYGDVDKHYVSHFQSVNTIVLDKQESLVAPSVPVRDSKQHLIDIHHSSMVYGSTVFIHNKHLIHHF